jgi:hypothetical protein
LKVGALSEMGNTSEIAARFGGPAKLREAVIELQKEIYAA